MQVRQDHPKLRKLRRADDHRQGKCFEDLVRRGFFLEKPSALPICGEAERHFEKLSFITKIISRSKYIPLPPC